MDVLYAFSFKNYILHFSLLLELFIRQSRSTMFWHLFVISTILLFCQWGWMQIIFIYQLCWLSGQSILWCCPSLHVGCLPQCRITFV